MKEIKAQVEVLSIPEPTERLEVLMHLERIGRICYKSEDKITKESCIKFVQNLRNRKHWAMLEHYIFAISVPKDIYDNINDPAWKTPENADLVHALNFIKCTYWEEAPAEDYKYIISGSATAFNYLWECNCFRSKPMAGIPVVCNFIANKHPELMAFEGNMISNDSKMRFLYREEIRHLPYGLRLLHDFQSVIFTVDRGVTHELVRHRPAAWAQESTRYCNYSSGKFENEITFIKPFFYDDTRPFEYGDWKEACYDAEKSYNDLIEGGSTPQEARSVLPQSVKADIGMTATLGEFRHFFKMRVPKTAHPQMREVSIPLLNFMKVAAKGMYDDMICYGMEDDLTIVDKEAK